MKVLQKEKEKNAPKTENTTAQQFVIILLTLGFCFCFLPT